MDTGRARVTAKESDSERVEACVRADYAFIEEQGVVVVDEYDAVYPLRIAHALGAKKPAMFFCVGNADLLNRPALFIGGSRAATDEGLRIAYRCGRIAAEAGYVVASGYARGVDTAAHIGAIEGGGSTIALLPAGLAQFRLRRGIAGAIEDGAFLAATELPPSASFSKRNAFRRNRLLATLGLAAIIIEAGDTGGSWHAAGEAVKYGRPLFYHPGARPEYAAKMEALGAERILERHGAPVLDAVFKRCGGAKEGGLSAP